MGFVFGLALGIRPLLKAGFDLSRAFHQVLIVEGLSIAAMKTAEVLVQVYTPGVMDAGLTSPQLLKRVFEIDMAACPQCGSPLTIIAAIGDPAVLAKILAHLGLPTRTPPRSPARACDLFQTA